MISKKKSLFVSLALMFAFVMALGSCTTTYPVKEHGLNMKLEPRAYDILGRVTYKGTQKNVLGLFYWGGASFEAFLKEAQKQYPNADDILNVTIDYTQYNVGVFYNSRTYIMSGIAVKYKK